MVELHFPALYTQEIEIGVVLMLCHTEYLPPFQVEYNFPMTLVLLNQCDATGTVKKHKHYSIQMDTGSIIGSSQSCF